MPFDVIKEKFKKLSSTDRYIVTAGIWVIIRSVKTQTVQTQYFQNYKYIDGSWRYQVSSNFDKLLTRYQEYLNNGYMIEDFYI